MFEYSINRNNLKDLKILPFSRYFDDVKIALIPFHKEDKDEALNVLFEQGYLPLRGTLPLINGEHFNLYYLVKPSKEVTDHIGTDGISVEIPVINDPNRQFRNVVFKVAMSGSTTGMSHTAIAGQVEEKDILESLTNVQIAHDMTAVAHTLFHKLHPNHKYSDLDLNCQSVAKAVRTMFIAASIQYNMPELKEKALSGELDHFYNRPEQMKIITDLGIQL